MCLAFKCRNKRRRKATVTENPSRKKISKVGLKNTQIYKTLTFMGHSYPYDEL